MVVSNELVHAMTRANNAFLRKNLNGNNFTADPFSANNVPRASSQGFHTRNARGLVASSESGKVGVLQYKSAHHITKKGKKNNRKALSLTYTSKTVDLKKNSGKGDAMLGQRGLRLRAVSQRNAQMNKQSK